MIGLFNQNRIRSHKFGDKSWVTDRYDFAIQTIDEYSSKISEMPFALSSLAGYSLDTAVYEWVVGTGKSKILDHLRLAHLARTWHWKGLFGDGPWEVRLPGVKPFTTGKMRPNIDVMYSNWLQGIELAMIFRDKAAVEVYCAAPYAPFHERGTMVRESWSEPWMNFLKGVKTNDAETGANFKKALLLGDPDQFEGPRKEIMHTIFNPLFDIWGRIFMRDQDAFNTSLLRQQKLWKQHFTQDEDHQNRLEGFVNFPALAACCYAHDKGFKITVQSDYLPEFLIKGDFPKLEWPDPEWKG